jgi:hypothetical protein
MTVSIEMVSAMEEEISNFYQPNVAAQAVVNAAWHEFDPDDETTWPYPKVVKGEKKWLVAYGDASWMIDLLRFSHGEWRGFRGDEIVRYADLNDLLHVRKED